MFSMLDEDSLKWFMELIWSSATSCEIKEDVRCFFYGKVPEKTFIDQFWFNWFPELIVLQLHCTCSSNNLMHGLGAFSIQSWHLFFYFRQNYIPKLLGSYVVIITNVQESIANLEIAKMFCVFIENKSVIIAIVSGLHCWIYFMEEIIRYIWIIIVTSSMHHPELHIYQWGTSLCHS